MEDFIIVYFLTSIGYTFSLTYVQSWPKISAPLVNMIKECCEHVSALLILLIKKSLKSNLSLDNKNLKWG